MTRRTLIICGILSSLVYLSTDIIGGKLWGNYSWLSQEFSRLSAIGAPSRQIHLLLSILYSLLVVAFGTGVWLSAFRNKFLRVIGLAFIIYAIGNWMWPQFFPEDLSQPVSAITNTMHIVLTVVTVLTWLLILGFAAAGFRKWMRLYSIFTLLIVILFGALAGSQGAALAAGQPTPMLGLMERINIYSFMTWLVVFAIVLLRKTHGDHSNIFPID
ncbi:MAG TPA: DUF998 domain-containing protein [Bacteroidales bacterium]|nr:DUF998 domain-containing protein [Bacteroidales bacterium]